MQDLRPVLNKLFVGKIEQVRVADLETAAKRKISNDEHWSNVRAGMYKFNYSMVYDYNRKAEPPIEIVGLEPSSLQLAVARIPKERRHKKRVATAVDALGLAISSVGYERIAALNGIDMSKYSHLDNGRRRMLVGNVLRARKRRNEPVNLGIEPNASGS